jgi:superoxide dismutase, Cu-Zn family
MRYARAIKMLAATGLVAGVAAFMPMALAGAGVTGAEVTDSSSARATVRAVDGSTLGVVSIQRLRNGHLVVGGQLSGLTPGFHGFHIHAVGICDPRFVDPTGAVVPFGSAGGHLNPGGTTHGSHAGDLPVLFVSDDGTARSLTETDEVTLAQILDADGGAFIVHAAPDNLAHIPTRYTATGAAAPGPDAATQATGDAGARVGCGIIRS